MLDMNEFGKQLDKIDMLDLATWLVGCYTPDAVNVRYEANDLVGLRQMACDVATDCWNTFDEADAQELIEFIMAV